MTAKKTSTKVDKKPEVKHYGFITGSEQLGEPIPRARNKVVICGFAPSSCEDVRHYYGNGAYEIWGLNQLYMQMPHIADHATRWFQIHHRSSYDANANRDISHHDWMKNQRNFPIYMQKREPDIPLSLEFPKDEIMAHFGNYFTNSISWMIAVAIYEGFEEIVLLGVDMSTDGEYAYERPSVEFFCGWARGRDIKLIIPEKSDIMKTLWVYPFDDTAPFRAKIQARRMELRQRLNHHAENEQVNHDARMQLLGALDNMNYIQRCWESSNREMEVAKLGKGK